MKVILFIDNTYPDPYQLSTLNEKALGGTESSVIRTAKILSKQYQVFVAQKFRSHVTIENSTLSFIPKNKIDHIKPDYIVVLRKYKLLKSLKKQFPRASLYLWIHTYKNYEYVLKRVGLSKTKTCIVCNSNTHMKSINNILNKTIIAKIISLFIQKTKITFCYNPVSKPVLLKSRRNINKLLFLSSPNKGLDQSINCFEIIAKSLPELHLYIANPGYKNSQEEVTRKNITFLGSLPHKHIMNHISESLCVFYPQDSFAETFGLIYAEANACGTAVLAHDIGSAREILDKNNPIVDVNNTKHIIEIIKKWQKEYPVIGYNCYFNDEYVFIQWQSILN